MTTTARCPALELIRASTADVHRALEATLTVGRLDAGDAEYTRYLGALLGWLEPLEARLWSSSWPDAAFVERRRGKVRWVEHDLSARGMSSAALASMPRQHALPPLASPAERFGVAYVVEGAQLGGQLLLKRLAPRVAPLPTRFLQGYGGENSAMWRAFVQALAEHLSDRRAAALAAESARATFELAHTWFRLRGVA